MDGGFDCGFMQQPDCHKIKRSVTLTNTALMKYVSDLHWKQKTYCIPSE